jgi:hypothetical protein
MHALAHALENMNEENLYKHIQWKNDMTLVKGINLRRQHWMAH